MANQDYDNFLDRRRLKRSLLIWRIVAVAGLIAVIAIITRQDYKPRGDHIARIAINNIIFEDADRENALSAIAKDGKAKALIVRINSPGGTTTGSEALFLGLRRIAAKKPVVAVIGTIGTSGGYIAAIAADHIVARETSLTGSIGVLFETAEFSKLMEKVGMRSDIITSGPLKGQPNPAESMSADTRRVLQAMIDDTFVWFIDLVRDRRKLSETQLEIISDGRVFTGRQARLQGLIDGFGGEREARAWLLEKHQIATALPVEDVSWGKEKGWLSRLFFRTLGIELPFGRHKLDGLLSVWQPR